MGLRKDKYAIIQLGCSKNDVDAASIAQVLDDAGMRPVSHAGDAEVVIVNTCGFIDAAKAESIRVLRGLVETRKRGQMVIAAGCLAQRYGAALTQEVPGLDGVIGTRRWMDMHEFVLKLRGRAAPEPLYHLPTEARTVGRDERGVLRASVQGASAYLKIADGCRRPCAFCAIPAIKGTAVSRPINAIAEEALRLQDAGVQELILIAQDTTDYGYDLGLKDGLAHLLEAIVAAAPAIPWIRVMYAYPGYVTPRLIETMATHKQILPYLDMPLQHGHRETLKRMKRPAKVEWVYETLAAMRAAIPDLTVRTTFIVGYPGETDEEFATLIRFIDDLQFDRAGAFTYSYEIGTPSATLSGHVPDHVKQARYEALMTHQHAISLRKNESFIGRTLDILVEGHGDAEDDDGNPAGTISVGRSYRDAPEIDGFVIVEGTLPAGTILPVRITGATAHDLYASADLHPLPLIVPGRIYGEGEIGVGR